VPWAADGSKRRAERFELGGKYSAAVRSSSIRKLPTIERAAEAVPEYKTQQIVLRPHFTSAFTSSFTLQKWPSAESVGKKTLDIAPLQRVGFFALLKKQADMHERSQGLQKQF